MRRDSRTFFIHLAVWCTALSCYGGLRKGNPDALAGYDGSQADGPTTRDGSQSGSNDGTDRTDGTDGRNLAGGPGDGPGAGGGGLDAQRDVGSGDDGGRGGTDSTLSADSPMDRPPGPPADMGPNCMNACTMGQKRCQPGGLQECATMGGCTVWGIPMACSGSMTCQDQGGSPRCACPAGTCTLGGQQCGPAGGPQTCTMQTGGCPGWGPETACSAPKICRASNGQASCVCPSGGCTVGAQECGPGGGVRSCSLSNDCPAWGQETSCPAPRTCQQSGVSASCACPASGCVPTSGLLLHVEADRGLTFGGGNELSRWADQSPLGHDGVPLMQPATRGRMLAGSPVVDFAGSGAIGPISGAQGVSFGSGYVDFRGGFSSFVLVRVEDPGVPVSDIELMIPQLHDETGNDHVRVYAGAESGELTIYVSTGGTAHISARTPALGRWVLVSVVQSPAGAAAIYVDGALVAAGNLPAAPLTTRTAYLAGGIRQAEAAALIVYGRGLSAAERMTVEQHIATTWKYK